MKIWNSSLIATAVALALAPAAQAGTVNNANMTTFSAGSPAVAAEVNGNFAEHTTQINHNAESARIDRHLRNYLSIPVPNRAFGNTGPTNVIVYWKNVSATTCNVRYNFHSRTWELGANSHTLNLLLTYQSANLVGTTSPIPLTTVTTLATVGTSFNAEANTQYTVVTLSRNATDPLDTCGPDDVKVAGARANFPNGESLWIEGTVME